MKNKCIPVPRITLAPGEIGSIENPAATGIELQTAMINAPAGATVYLVNITLTEQLLFSSLPDIVVTLASPSGTAIITSLVEHPFYGFNFNNTIADITFQNVIYDGLNIGFGFRFSFLGATFTLNNLLIKNCINQANGGAIHVNAGDFIGNNCIFDNNISLGNGGGVFIRFGTALLNNCRFSGNSAFFNGGGLYVSGFDNSTETVIQGVGIVTAYNCAFTGNSAGAIGFGGGIFADGAVYADNVIVKQNTATCGGGISGGNVFIRNGSVISDNTARVSPEILELFRELAIPAGGGGIYVDNLDLSVTDSVISGNAALNGMDGGGVLFSGQINGNAFFTDTAITNNSAPNGDGGGIFTYMLPSVNVNMGSIFNGNTAQSYAFWEVTTDIESDIHLTHILTNSFSTFLPEQTPPLQTLRFTNAYNNYDINFVRPVKVVMINYISAFNNNFVIHSISLNSFLGAVAAFTPRNRIFGCDNRLWGLQCCPAQCTEIIELENPDIDYFIAFLMHPVPNRNFNPFAKVCRLINRAFNCRSNNRFLI